jgi:myosin heavy subunit
LQFRVVLTIGCVVFFLAVCFQLPIYSPAIMKDYRERLLKMERVAPHVYSLADAAYANLRSEEKNQSIIISGESGAGKTEAMKLCLQYMAEMSGQGNDVEQQLLSSNPIIEVSSGSELLCGSTARDLRTTVAAM